MTRGGVYRVVAAAVALAGATSALALASAPVAGGVVAERGLFEMDATAWLAWGRVSVLVALWLGWRHAVGLLGLAEGARAHLAGRRHLYVGVLLAFELLAVQRLHESAWARVAG